MQWSRDAEAGVATPPPAGLLPVMSTEDYKQIRADEPRSHRGRNLLVLTIVLGVLAALIGYYFGVGRYTDTPQLQGKAEASARQFAIERGFKFHVSGRQYSENFDNGVVITTSPEPGDKILPGGTINAIISKGKHRVFLPANLKGMTVDEATAALRALDLSVGSITQKYDDKVDKDLVIGAADYNGKTPLRLGTRVNLVTSKGREPVDVVDYTGKNAVAAEAALKKAGFKVTIDPQFNDTVAKGLVISQSPKDGTKFKGDRITLTVSKGKDLVAVPNVLNMKKNKAIATLEAAGFKVTALPGGNYDVVAQSPAGGKKVKRGSTVAISPVTFP